MDDQLSMCGTPDPVPALPYQPHSKTSREAAKAAAPRAVTHRALVFDLLCLGGLIDEEIQTALNVQPPGALRARRVELVKAGLVRDSGKTRLTSNGRAATVWEVVK